MNVNPPAEVTKDGRLKDARDVHVAPITVALTVASSGRLTFVSKVFPLKFKFKPQETSAGKIMEVAATFPDNVKFPVDADSDGSDMDGSPILFCMLRAATDCSTGAFIAVNSGDVMMFIVVATLVRAGNETEVITVFPLRVASAFAGMVIRF